MRWLVIVCLLSSPARAETADTLAANGRVQAILTAQDEVLVGALGSFGRRWDDRWQVAVDVGACVGDTGGHVFAVALFEAGMWLHPSNRIDLELGLRAGYAYIHLSYGAQVDALALEPVIAINYKLGSRRALRFEPFVMTAYHSGLTQAVFGPQVGYVWTL